MEYQSILDKVEEQKKEKNIAGKMFRYSGLILAVDFFSQKLNPEQIFQAAFDFVNELLTLDRSYEFSGSDGIFELVRCKGANPGPKLVEPSENFRELAVFHGGILAGKENILKYFHKDLIEAYNPELIMPIITGDRLEGFILIPDRSNGIFDDDDLIICEVLMKLANSAMENFRRYTELQSINASLDEKIFNLFAINQSSRALLSELDIDALYRLSTDVFSELTQSSSTGFVLYDDKTEKYILKSYRLIYDSEKKLYAELNPDKTALIDPNKIIIDLSKESDADYLENIFPGAINELKELEPLYLVLLNRGKEILGFVTLGPTVTGMGYGQSVFELVESLASSTYISISNAKHFRTVKEQRQLLQNKLDRLISLHSLTKNINSSADIDTLLEITLDTLRISFGAEKCLIALYDKEGGQFRIEKSRGLGRHKKVIDSGKAWGRLFKGRTTCAFNRRELENYIGCDPEGFGDVSAALMVPIYLDKSEIELLGIIIVFEFSNSRISDEENILTIETIAGHIAPILHSLQIIEEKNTLLAPNYAEFFKNELRRETELARELELELCVLKIAVHDEFCFDYPDIAGKIKARLPKAYPVSYNTVYALTCEKINGLDIEAEIRALAGIDGLTVKSCLFGRDFMSFDDFFAKRY